MGTVYAGLVTDICQKETKGFGLPLLEAMACGCHIKIFEEVLSS